MFMGCNALRELNLSNLDTSQVTTMAQMFYECYALTSLDVSGWDTSSLTSMYHMFNRCNLLESLDLSSWDVSNVTNMEGIFDQCSKLANFKAPKNISCNVSFYYCPLTHESLMSIINNLATVTETRTLQLGSVELAKLTAEEIAIATNKGWTLI
jgi:surface protein